MANTLQVDGLACISGLTPAANLTHPQPLKDIPPRLIIYVVGGGETKVTVSNLVRHYELPANKANLNKAKTTHGYIHAHVHRYREHPNY